MSELYFVSVLEYIHFIIMTLLNTWEHFNFNDSLKGGSVDRMAQNLVFSNSNETNGFLNLIAVIQTSLSLIDQNMQTLQISADNFFNHVEKFYRTWTNAFSKDFDCVLITSGKSDDTNPYLQAALGWFFGYNITPITILFSKKQIYIFASESKLKILSHFAGHSKASAHPLVFLKRQKHAEQNSDPQKRLVDVIENSSKNPKVGVLLRKKNTPPDEFQTFIKDKTYQNQDCLPLLTECLVTKDSSQLKLMQQSSLITCYFFQKLVDNILQIIDNEKPVAHNEIAAKIESLLESGVQLGKAEVNLSAHGIKKELIDNICNGPAIQSGGNFTIKLLPEPNQEHLKLGSILVGFGCKYQLYNSFVTRTLLIGKSEYYEVTYGKILQLHKLIISSIQPGKKIKLVYKKALDYIKVELPDSEVPANFGSGIGLIFRQNSLIINDTNQHTFEANMTFLVTCGFKDFKIPNSSETFAVQLSDVIQVNDKGPCLVMTENDYTKKTFKKIFWEFSHDDNKKKKQKNERTTRDLKNQENQAPAGRSTRRKNQKKQAVQVNLKQRNAHQTKLKNLKLQEQKLRLNETFSGDLKKVRQIESDKIQCYKNREELPKDMKKNKIFVDARNNALILPINGVMVPFHINTLKNIVKNDEGSLAILRFNFHLPVSGLINNIKLPKLNSNTVYIKQLTYRSQNIKSFTDVFKNVKELQKKMKNLADDQKNKEDIVAQDKLLLNKNKKPLLRDLGVKPNLTNKKDKGSLECHLNGFRYTSLKSEPIDITFSNIKHAFIQPSEQSIAAVHFRLYSPILVGKKKTEDIQFYVDVGGVAEDVQKNQRNDDDDSDDEELIKIARKKIDKELLDFSKACEEYIKGSFQWQIPNKGLGFSGTPFKTTSLLMPTKHCLVNLTDQPFFILNLEEVEIVWFERMFANLSTFDMVFVYKDFQKFVRIQAIPIIVVEMIKNWLDKSNLIFCDIKRIIDWSKFLAPIRADFKIFVEDGGWGAWDDESNESEVEGDSAFTPEVSAYDESSDSDESSAAYGEDEDDQDQGSYDAQEDLSEEGLSESAMERRFQEQDRQKAKKQLEKSRVQKKKQ